MTGRRFLWRWNVRMSRRQWRRQLGLFVMTSLAVALSVGGTVAAFNLVEPPGFRYGTGDVRATISGGGRDAIELLDTQDNPFAALHVATVATPGAKPTVQVRVIDPANPVSQTLLALVDGRWPENPNEIAITDDAQVAHRGLGSTVELGGGDRVVVGIVENPTALRDEFVLTDSLTGLATYGWRRDSGSPP